MKKISFSFLAVVLLSLTLTSCRDYEDFDFSGTVIGYRYCTSMSSFQDLGYFVKLDAPDSVGGTLRSEDGKRLDNVVVIYNTDRMLRDQAKIHGRIYLEPSFSKANCTLHSTGPDKDLPEAVFTKVVVD